MSHYDLSQATDKNLTTNAEMLEKQSKKKKKKNKGKNNNDDVNEASVFGGTEAYTSEMGHTTSALNNNTEDAL